jgi:triphosphoribosyl-dephospho-CoA synthase
MRAVEATREAVGHNTNLGILLLAAPLAQARLDRPGLPLDAAVAAALAALTMTDAEDVFAAIRLAAPGGLGDAAEHDVREPPRVGLVAAMAAAAGRDRIAWNWTHGFQDVLRRGPAVLDTLEARGWAPAEAASGLFMTFLAELPDSHVARRCGAERALRLRSEAAALASAYLQAARAADHAAALLGLDARLKADAVNPGTSADLTVGALLARRLRADGIPVAASKVPGYAEPATEVWPAEGRPR